MNDIVISDTTALIILAKSDAFSLLSNLFQKIYIPKAVYDELMVKDDIVNYRIKEFDKIEVKPVTDTVANSNPNNNQTIPYSKRTIEISTKASANL